jgi:ankyrin repeat protein
MTPDERLLAAARTGDAAAARAALQDGADANARHHYEEAFDRERIAGDEPVLQLAARGGHHDVVAALLARGADPSRGDTVRGVTPLVEAAARGDLPLVTMLLAAKARPVADPERPHADAFATAVGNGHAAVAAALVRAGATATPAALALACHRGSVELAALCVRVGARLDDPRTDALGTAARSGSVALLRWLVEQGSDVVTHGGDALCEAANAGRTDAVALLLELGAPHAHRNSYGWTPLHFAAYQADPATCRVLLDAGADPRADDGTGKTPLAWAREAGKADNAALLERVT